MSKNIYGNPCIKNLGDVIEFYEKRNTDMQRQNQSSLQNEVEDFVRELLKEKREIIITEEAHFVWRKMNNSFDNSKNMFNDFKHTVNLFLEEYGLTITDEEVNQYISDFQRLDEEFPFDLD